MNIPWWKRLLLAAKTASPFTSLGVVGGAMAFLALALNTGVGSVVVTQSDQGALLQHGMEAWEAGVLFWTKLTAFVGILMGIYGRVRALKSVAGFFLK